MAQGTRGRWVRVVTTGFGVVLCTGLVGCMNWDKSKDTKGTNQPKAGLPGTPTLPPNTGASANKGWQPGAGQFSGNGANLQQTGGFGTAQPNGAYRPGSTGMNTNTSGTSQPYNWPAQPGNPGYIGSPAQPTSSYPTPSVLPAGGVGAAPYSNTGAVANAAYSPTPPPPSLVDTPRPPAPPIYGSSGNEFAGGVLPPVAPGPIAPIAPAGVGPTYPTKGGF